MFALLNRLISVLILCGAVKADTGVEDANTIDLNPLEYVPLAVGNRWTYEHIYHNYLSEDEWLSLSASGFFPPAAGEYALSDSIRLGEKILTVEITHTEVINGLEYFVFSDADYSWPPLPGFFWSNKKVRLSDEGILIFHWEGRDVSVYDFSGTSDSYTYHSTLPIGSGTSEVSFNRTYTQHQTSRVYFNFDYFSRSDSPSRSVFTQGYGMGLIYFYVGGLCGRVDFRNALGLLSATIDGKEVVYERNPHFESTGVGQVSQIRMGEGFDFSQEKHSDYFNDFNLVMHFTSDPFGMFTGLAKVQSTSCLGFSASIPSLLSETGVARLGEADFDLLVSKGILPNLQLGPISTLLEGYLYAVQSREGGIALLNVFDVEFDPESYARDVGYNRALKNIKFDWIYYPDGLPEEETAIQSISWGQLKHIFPGRNRPYQDSPNRLGK